MQSAALDLQLLEAAARDAGRYAHQWFGKPREVQSKGAAGPVTEVDFAVDAMLKERLRAARPDYGWLSEETPDDHAARIGFKRSFSLDPIDGTSAFIQGAPEYTISVGVIEDGRAIAGAIYNPSTDQMFLGAEGVGATHNGTPMYASSVDQLEAAHLVGDPRRFADKRWPTPWPRSMQVTPRQSIALRLALVAAGAFDGVILFGWKNEWDISAGAAIIEAAGGRFTDALGNPVKFNQPDPRAPGVVAAGAALHPLIIERASSAAPGALKS
ncbi:inositol monophosphatase family protein [alpha proteobacterium U9-1i]|nr:inositol monophosphatase family protein [alpha proteobacterium U9-1i]